MTIETKFNVGDNIYFMFNNKITNGLINDIIYRKGNQVGEGLFYSINILNYRITDCSFKEDLLFSTKEELLKSL